MTKGAAYLLRVNMRTESGIWHASSNDLPGLHVCGDSIEKTCERVIKAIKAIFKHSKKLDVEVVPASDMNAFPEVKMPCEQFVIQQRLAA
jgi:predicted RNase H-like HicB family nuclease